MTDSDYPGDVQFAGLVEAATQEMHRYGQHETSMAHDQDIHSIPSSPSSRKRKRTSVLVDEPQPQDAIASALFRQPSENSKRYTRPPMSTLYSSLQLSPEDFLRLQAAAKSFMLDDRYPDRRDCVGQRGAGENADLVKLKLWNCVKEFLDDNGYGEKYWGHHNGDQFDGSMRTLFWPQDSEKIIKLCIPLLRRMVTNERQRKYAAVSRKGGGEKPTGRKHKSPFDSEPHVHLESTINVIPDMLEEGSIPTETEAVSWYKTHSSQVLLQSKQSLLLDERTFRHLVANLDGHFRIYHRIDVSECDAMCHERILERLKEWTNSVLGKDDLTGTDDVESRLEPLIAICKGDAQKQPTAPTPVTRIDEDPVKRSSKTNLVVHVNIMSAESASAGPSRRLIPRFSLTPESATNLAVLQSEVQKRYQAVAPNGMSGERPFQVKVWLSDGLVPVNDDGDWMVALLSASMVEWMDGEVRVLVEV